ncbi:MAG: hypothetical protein FWD47_00930 [Treponema sp.]|nr:hypothetical protein [Treponema sp.]
MKKKIILPILFIIICSAVFAQTVHDPNSDLYKDIDRWFVQGYITEFLPMVRPYPPKLINNLLDQVIANGNTREREQAEKYRDELAPGSRFLNIGTHVFIQGNDEDYNIIAAPYAEGLFHIRNLFTASYNLTFFSFTNPNGESFNVPGTYTQYPDLVDDNADIGSFRILQNWTSLVAIGSSDIYFQAGLSRSSFGPFYDNGIVVGPQAPRAGHFSFMYWDPLWSMEILFQTLIATDDYGKGSFPSKYNIIHSLNIRPLKNLELGIVQALVYGERLDILYLVPFSFLFGSQTINGFDDNAFIGLNFRWRPFTGFLVSGQVYIDDFSFNGLLKGDIYFKAAAEIGISWAPTNKILSKLDFDYTAVTPYTYSHWHETWGNKYNGQNPNHPDYPFSPPIGDQEPRIGNFLNYTHMGRNIGPDLDPNSDRISVRSYWKVIPNLNVNLSAYLIRHGNASAGKDLLDPAYHDGSIFDAGTTDPWITLTPNDENYYQSMYFLSQDVLETRLGGTIGIIYTIPSSFGVFKLVGEYGIQHTWNRWNRNINPMGPEKGNNGFDHFWSIGCMWSW